MTASPPDPIPTPTRGVLVVLDRPRRLRYTLGTLRRIREEFGEAVLSSGVAEDKLAKILWYGLRTDDPSLKPEDIEELIDLQQLPELVKALEVAMGGTARARVVEDPQPPAPIPVADGSAGSP